MWANWRAFTICAYRVVDPPQEHRKRVVVLRNRNQMNMIPHQAPGQHPHPGVGQIVRLQARIRPPIGVPVGDGAEPPLPLT